MLVILAHGFLATHSLAKELRGSGAVEEPLDERRSALLSTKQYEDNGQTINFAFAGNKDLPGILFLHGTPGSWTAFESYLANKELQDRYFMLSVDRPGWGNSRSSAKMTAGAEMSFTHQTELLGTLLDEFGEKEWLVVGHSLGASIAPKMAVQFPQKITSLLLLAGSHEPKLGKPRWYNRIANTRLAIWMLPSHLNYSNKEIMSLRKELTTLESELAAVKLDTKVTIIQGMKDKLVSPKNADYVEKNWPNSFREVKVIKISDAGHFIPWEQSKQVVKSIQELHR